VCVKRVVVDGDAESHFRFCGGSLGNFFFSGARMFCGSLQSAVTLWKLISNMPTLTEVCKNKSLQCARLFSSTEREIFISIWCLSARLRRRVYVRRHFVGVQVYPLTSQLCRSWIGL
jgi:hypothetical protein